MQRRVKTAQMRELLAFAVFAAASLVFSSCDKAPSSPGPLPPVWTPPPSPPPPASIAMLAIEQLSVVPLSDPRFGYDVRFQLRETSGNSGATLQDVFVGDLFGGGDHTGPGCWGQALRVPPGGTLDTFYSDAGRNWLSYCGVGGSHPTKSVRVLVMFTDDDGRLGSVVATLIA